MMGQKDKLAGCALAALALLAFVAAGTQAADPAYRLAEGSGSIVHSHYADGRERSITVRYHRPEGAGVDAPVVFVMHGRSRNGEAYHRHWVPHADEGRYILLTPEFSAAEFRPIRLYHFGNVMRGGAVVPEAEWTFAAVENIFDAVRHANALAASQYDIYGHSAGGQFVHRLVLVMPDARFRVAVAANAGSYAMLDPGKAYPYGVGRLEPERWRRALGRRLIVLLGDEDNDPHAKSLPRAPQAMAQGAHRLERGERFFSGARSAAAKLGLPFNWSLEIAQGSHDDEQMAVAAARFVGRDNRRITSENRQ
jgi:poly(3-hydroxybutyrate) depolymerase